MENRSSTTNAPSTRSKEDQTHETTGYSLLCNSLSHPDSLRPHPPPRLPQQPSTHTLLRHRSSKPKHRESRNGLHSKRRSRRCGKLHKPKQEKQYRLQLHNVRALLLQHTHSNPAHRAIHCSKGNVHVHELPSREQPSPDSNDSEPGVAASARYWSCVVEPERNVSRSLERWVVNEILLLVAHTLQHLFEEPSFRVHASKKMHYKTLAIFLRLKHNTIFLFDAFDDYICKYILLYCFHIFFLLHLEIKQNFA
ncbi:unnamed protein product [Eruca vesicaria subsp. sativa]|uniref:Uncharacterized protein n=1 Tax=Eruca vesicaria subsp. sativa TaxID=29727 RepID=A0ABC8LYB2_ERUVS|nr:unnamed protein product [Eruca vesicaria subsp. sativa]